VAEPKPPTDEQGAPAQVFKLPGFDLLGGSRQFIDDREYVPELQWPGSIQRYRVMQSEAQMKGLLLASTLPVRRFAWAIDPNGARPAVVEDAAEAWNLPIKGQEAPVKRRAGVNHDRHMAHSFQALGYGHFYFEEVYEYAAKTRGGDGKVRLVKLATRPPRTIANFLIDDHGALEALAQNTGGTGAGVFGGIGTGPKLDFSRLLPYVFDTEDDGDWIGRPLIRACWKNWLIKDRLLRVDATKHERNAMGIPWVEVDAKASKPQIDKLAKMAEEVRASERGGGAGPGRLHLQGVEGTLPDTIGSVRYHDEQMAKSFLILFFNLGGGAETGNRALGESFIDWYTEQQGALADWYVEATQSQIERQVLYNYGPDEQPPRLTYTRVETAEVAFSDLVNAVDKGLIAVDDELSAYIGQRWRFPASTPEPAPAAPPPTEPPGPTPAPPAAAEPPRRRETAPKTSALAARIEAEVTTQRKWVDVCAAIGIDPKGGTGRRARDELVNLGILVKRLDSEGAVVLAPLTAINLPDRDLKRQPHPFEVTASVDFAQMETVFLDGREALVEAVKSMQSAQIDELAEKVEAAAGDVGKLTTLTVEPVDADVIAEHLRSIAAEGVAAARAEHNAQTVASAVAAAEITVDEAKLDRYTQERAEAVAATLAGGFAAAASKRASAVATLPAADAAADVRSYLGGLSDAELELQLGGSTQQAYNGGRRAYMSVSKPTSVYASEILDGNTCSACNGVDGSEWETLAEAEVAYPLGGYVECEAGFRCRGTLVAVY
jgi:hypothetical protein